MTIWISLLRGINVGGHRKVPMAQLREMYAGLGFSSVKSYIQSGNVLFRSDEADAGKLAEAISAEIKTTFDFDVPVIVKSVEAVQQALAASPFLQETIENLEKHVMVAFVQGAISAEKIAAYTPPNNDPAQLRIIGKDIHLYYPNGQGRTKLTINYIERKLGIAATTRNIRSVKKLLDLASLLP